MDGAGRRNRSSIHRCRLELRRRHGMDRGRQRLIKSGLHHKVIGDDSAGLLDGYGSWTLIDENGASVRFEWYSQLFNDFEFAPYIEHDGATDAMNLNHPADGDIDIWGPIL